MFDGKAFGEQIVASVKAYIERALQPILSNIADIQRQLRELPQPKDGKDADPEQIKRLVADAVDDLRASLDQAVADLQIESRKQIDEQFAALPAPEKGKDGVTSEELKPVIAELVDHAVKAMPTPKDGNPGKDADPEVIKAMVSEAVAAIPPAKPGEDGKSVSAEDVAPMIEAAVEKRLAEWPRPKDGEPGKSVTLAEVAGMIAEEVTKAVAALPAPKDGVGVAGAMIDRAGALVLTLTDGSLRELGQVVGRDAPAVDTDAIVETVASKIQPPKNGRDGLGFDDLNVEMRDERNIVLRFARGETVKEFTLTVPAMIWRGVYSADQTYQRGDMITWGGSIFHCNAETTKNPDEEAASWKLAVKRGRDGKDGLPPKSSDPIKLR